MARSPRLTDLDLSALIASKICHDVIGPVGAIGNGLEILEEEAGRDSSAYALEVIRDVTQQATARLQYARFAFGAAGSAGSQIDLETARSISEGLVGGSRQNAKHRLKWSGPQGHLPKNTAKLLLNLVSSAITALPRGGEIELEIAPDLSRPEFTFRCKGRSARPPQYLSAFIAGTDEPDIDAMSIQAYYTVRLAADTGMTLAITQDGDDIVLSAT